MTKREVYLVGVLSGCLLIYGAIFAAFFYLTGCVSNGTKCRTVCIPGDPYRKICKKASEWEQEAVWGNHKRPKACNNS